MNFFSNAIIHKVLLKLFNQKYLIAKERIELARLSKSNKKKIIVGAGSQPSKKNWVNTNKHTLNLLNADTWKKYFQMDSIDNILAEHVWEHLTLEEGKKAVEVCYYFLKPGGKLRIAVPDGFHKSKSYIERVKPGGSGYGSDDHKVLYNYKTLSESLKESGFKVEKIEYFDENHKFHFKDWSFEDGLVHRSRFDKRNKSGQINYTSLIIDGIK